MKGLVFRHELPSSLRWTGEVRGGRHLRVGDNCLTWRGSAQKALCLSASVSLYLGAFAKLQKRNRLLASSCLTVRPPVLPCLCPSVRTHGSTPFALVRFSWILIFEDFSKIWPESSKVSLKSDTNKGHFTWRPIYIFHHTALSSS